MPQLNETRDEDATRMFHLILRAIDYSTAYIRNTTHTEYDTMTIQEGPNVICKVVQYKL